MSKRVSLLCCLLSASVFVGCGPNGKQASEVSASKVQEEEVAEKETAEKETAAETPVNVYDLEITADNQTLHESELKKLEIDAKTVVEIDLPDIAIIHYESMNKDGVNRFTKTGDFLFSGNEKLRKVSVPDSYIEIAYETFLNCSALTSVSLSEGLEEIGIQAFDSCVSLEEITIPSTVTKIGAFAFQGCEKLSLVTFAGDSRLNFVGNRIFKDCDNLTSIEYLGVVYESPEDFYEAFGAMEGHTLE